MKTALYEKNSMYLSAVIIDGKCPYSGTLAETLKERYPQAVEMPMGKAMELISIKEDKEYLKDWKEITEERFNDMLECLPPEKWERNALGQMFRMCEYYTGNITSHFAEINGRYFEAKRRTGPYKAFFLEIQKQFHPYR
jgi:hypothetical protein